MEKRSLLLEAIVFALLLTQSEASEGMYSKASKASKAGSGNSASPFGKIIEMKCGPPPELQNGRVSCTQTSSEQRCTGTCRTGYKFSGMLNTKEIVCYSDGVWVPSNSFPPCEPICDRPCENSGTCLGHNYCKCTGNFWGKYCETPLSICNIQKNRNLASKCNYTNTLMTCVIYCHEGMQFDSTPAPSYNCDTSGLWTPSQIPNCVTTSKTHVTSSYGGDHGYDSGRYGYGEGQHGYGEGQHGYDEGQSKIDEIEMMCGSPPALKNGRVNCEISTTEKLCSGTCRTGWGFSGMLEVKEIVCRSDGKWLPTKSFPICEPKCDQPCENGGTCMGNNYCRCAPNYWGKHCESHISICDIQKNRNVGFKCNYTAELMTCTVQCSLGLVFDFPPDPVYYCDPAGRWNPSNIPTCVSKSGGTRPGQHEYTEKPSPGHNDIELKCGTPPRLKNGRVSCTRSSTEQRCTGTCRAGYEFNGEKVTTKEIVCYSDGTWTPQASFPPCNPICDPPCQNDGVCTGHNLCVCPTKYWGPLCDSHISVCNVQEQSNVGAKCNYTSELMSCVLNCPDGMTFDSYPAPIYHCDTTGIWDPIVLPRCVPVNEIITTGKPEIPITSVPDVKRNGRCITWERKYFQSFDGHLFEFDGGCKYLLAKDCVSNSFAVYVDMSEKCNKDYCDISVEVFVDDEELILKNYNGKPSLFFGESQLPIPMSANNFAVQRISDNLIVFGNSGFRVLWDGKMRVQIDSDINYYNKTCGLCGRYDGGTSNDFEMADGLIAPSVLEFANSWKMDNIGDYCTHTYLPKDACYSLPANELAEARLYCEKIKSAEFAACLFVIDPTPYIDMCVSEYCTCHESRADCGCTALSAYFKECARLGGKLDREWRREDFCHVNCPNGMEYHDCGSDCPGTCSNPTQECSTNWCIDGCFCPEGLLVGPEKKCFQVENCPCSYQNKDYNPGSVLWQDCNNCHCGYGRWDCSEEVCEARCSSVGDPHYTTFDGKHYDFMGKCSYYLVKGTNYSIEQENIACDGAVSAAVGFSPIEQVLKPSCTKTITIRTQGSELHLKQDHSMVLNGRELSELPYFSPGMYVYTPSSSFIKIVLVNGLSILWDGESRVYIDAPPTLMGTLTGLCGTFTQTQKDDFYTPEGDIEKSVEAFANKWKTNDFCDDVIGGHKEHPCSVQPHLQEQAKQICTKIKSKLFSDCHDLVEPQSFYDNCMYDLCSCKNSDLKNCFCPTIADYAALCAKKGATIEWRQQVKECEISCYSGQVFSQCGSSCHRSCKDISSNTKCEEQCVEGCNCPQGLTLDDKGQCIPVSECPCLFNNREYPANQVDIREGLACTCNQAKWDCRQATAEELREADRKNTSSSCDKEEHMEGTDCVLECPLTCSNYHKPPVCETVNCKPGCQCKQGYVYDTKQKKCVHPGQCPCHHNDRSYGEGDSMQQDCNFCLCEGGQWKCEKKDCLGVCSAWGATHYKTFDGRMFEFASECEFTLVRGTLSSEKQFTVTIQNKPCGGADGACYKSVTLIVGSEELRLLHENPLSKPSPESGIVVREVGLFVVVHTDFGLSLYWDRISRVYVKLHSRWKNQITGLCGDYNDNEMDDFRSPLGGPVIIRPTAFADSWKVKSFCPSVENVEDSCEINSHRHSWAVKKCDVLTSKLFESCHTEVPVQPFLEACIKDTCACDSGGDCECTCTAIAAYAQECNIFGKPIKWRSQDLCPIQCRECDKYTPCMSVCPKTTCETEYLYKELSATCKDEMCVEGCDPPPCSANEIYEDDKNFTCIPKAECTWQPCAVINGKMYHEGERISDPEVTLPCQSCHCLKGKLNCVGEPCASTLVPPIVTMPVVVPEEECNYDPFWSEWINSYTPTYKNGGDYEMISEIVQGKYNLCPQEYVTAIECRPVGKSSSSRLPGIYHCGLPNGLVCENSDQVPDPLCHDYEIRLYCDCGKNTPPPTEFPPVTFYETTIPEGEYKATEKPPVACLTPGWTIWMRGEDYRSDIQSLRNKYSFCANSDMINTQCREVSTRKPSELFPYVSCDANGFTCLMRDKSECPMMEVRFNCLCENAECAAKLGMENGLITSEQITVSSAVDDREGRLNSQYSWSPESLSSGEWIQVELEELQEITGILTQGSPNSEEWITHYQVKYSTDGNDWQLLQEGGQTITFVGNEDNESVKRNDFAAPIAAKYIKIFPLDWINGISLRFELLGCNRFDHETPRVLEHSTYQPDCVKTGWTEWMNVDSPDNNFDEEIKAKEYGDHESIDFLRRSYAFCENPTSIQCRTADVDKLASHKTGQVVTCDYNTGLKCVNSGQKCLDYEVRLYCECEELTSPILVPTPEVRVSESTCPSGSSGYTQWMSVGDPVTDPEGDIESMEELRAHYEFCKPEYITNIECQVIDGEVDYTYSGQNNLKCDKEEGFKCLHSQQDYEFCLDYRVRFYCLCLEDTVTTTTKPTPTEEVKPETYSTSVVTHTAGPICAMWTGWINMSPAYREIEEELLGNIPNFYKKCPKPIKIECRQAHTEKDYREFPELYLDPDCNLQGIRCDNSINDGACPDFEINVYCECFEETTIPPVEVTIPPVCTPGWTEWFDIDNPNSGNGDFERIEDLRQRYAFCDVNEISDVKCEAVDYSDILFGGDVVDFKTKFGLITVKCNKEFGLECFNDLQPSKECLDYKISFHCMCTEPIETEVTPVIPVVEPLCNEWTDWIDNDVPYDGIEEELFTSISNFDKLCPIVDKVECLESSNDLDYTIFGLGDKLVESCTERGIKCVDNACPDLKIRAYCKCEGVTIATTPQVCENGWTEWFDVDDPDSDEGDFEFMDDLRSRYQFCSQDQIVDVECSTVDGIDYHEAGNTAVKCNKFIGAVCYNNMQSDKKCQDYKIRFNCMCGQTSPTLEISTTNAPICPDGYVWDGCAYSCNDVCQSFLVQAQEQGECPKEENVGGCIGGCVVQLCKPPYVWRDKQTCVMPEECTCLLENGKMLGPGEVETINKCEKCHCLNNELICEIVPGCMVSPVTETTTAPVTVTTMQPLIPVVQPDCWTLWLNEDTPEGYGDSETFQKLRARYEFCDDPVKIECRVVNTHVYAQDTVESVSCDLEHGLKCTNERRNKCSDYEVRFYCPCENVTLVTPIVITPTHPTPPVGPCVQGYTEWFNSHKPDEIGEYEQLVDIRNQGNLFCSSEYLTSMQCRNIRTNSLADSSENRGIVCDLNLGFYCNNEDQYPGETCDDYEVRFFCDCPTKFPPSSVTPTRTTIAVEETTTKTTIAVEETTTKTTPTIVEEKTTKRPIVVTTLPPLCAYWSRWINDDNPYTRGGDLETTTGNYLRKIENFCPEGEITNIQCVDVNNERDYAETAHYTTQCDLSSGFSCYNSFQQCLDYKIRYYCNCENVTTTASSIYKLTTIPSTTILVTSVPLIPVVPCTTALVGLVEKLPDENLKASSSFSSDTGPQSARLTSYEYAWTPRVQNKNQYIEFDLGSNQPVYGITTSGHPMKPEWVKTYRVLYSRDGTTFSYYTKPGSTTPKSFAGNYKMAVPSTTKFEQPFEARYIRIQPRTWNGQISLQADVLGCEEMTTSTLVPTPTPRECDEPMGFENHYLDDDQIMVSSYLDEYQSPSQIRLNTIETDIGAGAWLAETLDQNQFVQIDFREPRTLTGVTTQGRNGEADQYVTSYIVQYSNDGKTWHNVVDQYGKTETFRGNYDSDTPVTNYFYQPVRARYLRISPQSWNNWIAMRLEIQGCYEPYVTQTAAIANQTFTRPTASTFEIVGTPSMRPECNEPMGIERGELDVSQITLSSSLHGDRSGASRIGLNEVENYDTGGWLAAQSNEHQFVQFDFLKPVELSGIVTQGRDKYSEWVSEYVVEYSNDGVHWQKAYTKDHNEVFTGNYDNYTPVYQYFDNTIRTRYIRLRPVSWHDWISMRVEILGCYEPVPTEIVITDECIEYGPWINNGKPHISDGDEESIDKLITQSNMCKNPIEIKCRQAVKTHLDYRAAGQKVTCDLTHGLVCRHKDQLEGQRCFDYEAQIGCYVCPASTPRTGTQVYAICPEVPREFSRNCPEFCQEGELCDGQKCVSLLECPCFVDGKKFYPGDRIVTDKCDECHCQMDGYSNCKKKTCSPCAKGLISVLDENDCTCKCESCPDNTILCPTSSECIPEIRWCDGKVDCPDDEKDCATTPPTTVATCPPVPTCSSGTVLTVKNPDDFCPEYICEPTKVPTTPRPLPPIVFSCDMYSNYFKTFDGEEFPYDICDHILMQDKKENKFIVTVHKECTNDYKDCIKYVQIKHDNHNIRLNSDLSVVLNGQRYYGTQLTKLGKRINEFSLRTVGTSVIFKSNVYRFEVEWNRQQNAKVRVSEDLMYQVNGLCGYYNDDPKDDFEKPNGERATTVQDFGDSWAMGPLDNCKQEVCIASVKTEAIAVCNNILLPPLEACNDFADPQFFLSACVNFMCECHNQNQKTAKECECEAYSLYVLACKQVNPFVKLQEWRTKLGCSPTCPPGLVWKDCGPGCERSCDSLQEDLSECEDSSCVAGCFCPDGTVKKRENLCVPPEKCQDCVCDGYGDPHYTSFDRQYYPFQGNCTYVLARDKSPTGDHKFEVQITNDECIEEPQTTCTTAIMLIYNGHTAHFRVNHSITVDGVQLKADDFPLEYEGINITVTNRPGRIVTFKVDAINLEVRYFENNYGFQVLLPSEVYFNQTEGLCGNCNFDQSDDMTTKEGIITDDTSEFGLSWLAEPPEGMVEVNNYCVVLEEKPCDNVTAIEQCKVLLSRQFQPCHTLIDPETVLKACEFDVCHSLNPEDSLCRSLTEYARACSQAGICLQNWRTLNLCPVECPEGMYYDQCGPACIHTCTNKNEFSNVREECELDPIAGCFCLGNRLVKDEQCVDPIECETCDDEGHKVGETWQPNVCTNCECTKNLVVECLKIQCPTKPVCKKSETLLRVPSNNKTCCEEYYCIPKPPVICAETEIVECLPGEVLKPIRDDNDCVSYTCECDVLQCPPMKEPILSEVGQEVVVDDSACCPVKNVVCNKAKCPPHEECLPGEQLEIYNEKKCCPESRCVPPLDQCYYHHENEVTDNKGVKITDADALYEPGDTWNDGICVKCKCEGSPGHYNALCERENCEAPSKYITDNYAIEKKEVPGKCCPEIRRIVCLVNGTKYETGTTWPSEDGDNCKINQCSASPTGDVVKTTITTTCKQNCPVGFKYEFPSSSSGKCCGQCIPTGCVELGSIYAVGEEWESKLKKCARAKCVEDGSVGLITQYQTVCPDVPSDCPLDKIIRDENDCCDICLVARKAELCAAKVVNQTETVNLFQKYVGNYACTNSKPIPDLKQCAGTCNSLTIFMSGKEDFESSCLCCTPEKSETKTIELDCSNGSKTEYQYKQPLTCKCSVCSELTAETNGPLPSVV